MGAWTCIIVLLLLLLTALLFSVFREW